ncbi:hypothetical protein SIN8267_01238 [Sinobacterium norvegicum]|uniref:Lipoprotein n=1 Tax=Sinobacterium norvegicum TaxID=1641715 RepID=A0ABN8EM15_9GAMM|nr:hypothetical protein [Sinobacterium norvegicum]CAH0991136.1 hypothetical protein SIN8267_01238 [Sinobacterium norvegicum]
MHAMRMFIVALFGVVIIGCGADVEPDKNDDSGEGVILQHHIKAIDSAKAAKQAQLDADKARDEALKQQGY